MSRMGDASSVFDIALSADERALAFERHTAWLAMLHADGSDPEIAKLRFDRLHERAGLGDPARAWLAEAYACGAANGDLNERAVRAAFEDAEPDDLARGAFAQVFESVRRGQDTSVPPLERLRAIPDQRVTDALAASEAASIASEAAGDDYRARLRAARAAAQNDMDAANAEVTLAATDVQKVKRGFARVTPAGSPATWSDDEQAKYDAHVEKLRAAEAREDRARAAAADLESRVEASVDRSALDEHTAASAAASSRLLAAIDAERVRTRELALYAAIPVRADMTSTLERSVANSPFKVADLERLSGWAETQMQERNWGQDTVVAETRRGVTLSMVRMAQGWGLVGLSEGVTREPNVAAALRRDASGL